MENKIESKINNKLQVKDFIAVGLFAAVYYVVFFATMMLGYIPVLIVVLTLFTGITGGIPYMLFLTRVKKFGMVTLFGLVCGILTLLIGSGIYPFLTAVIFGIVADIILKSGGYGGSKHAIGAYSVFCLWTMGFTVNIFLVSNQAYMDSIKSAYGEEYVSALMNLMPGWMLWVGLAVTLAGGFLGGILGKKVLRKHFEKAGIA